MKLRKAYIIKYAPDNTYWDAASVSFDNFYTATDFQSQQEAELYLEQRVDTIFKTVNWVTIETIYYPI